MIEHYTKAFSSFGLSPCLITIGVITLFAVYRWPGPLFKNIKTSKDNQEASDFIKKKLKMNAASRKHAQQGYRQNNKN
jgi:hypothetical protein